MVVAGGCVNGPNVNGVARNLLPSFGVAAGWAAPVGRRPLGAIPMRAIPSTDRVPPAPLVYALLALALIVVIQFVLGAAILVGSMKGPPTLVIGALAGAVIWLGLYYRHRWAFVVVLLICPLNVVLALASPGRNPLLAILLNGLVFVPVLMSAKWFGWRGAGDSHELVQHGPNPNSAART